MAWFSRAGAGAAKFAAIRRTLARSGSSYAARSRAIIIVPSWSRYFHTTVSGLDGHDGDGTSRVNIGELQRSWEADPNSVGESWDNFFRNSAGRAPGQTVQESAALLNLVRAYQIGGHKKAKLDPLALEERRSTIPDDLDPAVHGFTEADLDREFFLGVWRMSGFMSENRPVQTLRSILSRLEQAYCGSIGYEYMNIADPEKCDWLRSKIETPTPTQYDRQRREVVLDRLIWSTHLENFLAAKWRRAKRFGLGGGETLIPGMEAMLDRSADLGVESIFIGMSQRGRFNVLGNVVRMPLRQIFSEFSGGKKPVDEIGFCTGTGDVKYHLGTSYDRPTRGSNRVHLSLVANPSHLEAADPVVIGKTRAKQYSSNDADRTKNAGIVIHGDGGTIDGQAVVCEMLLLSALPNYMTGGTIHIVVNNQVPFTTDPTYGISSQCWEYAGAQELGVPVFHVNGDDVEAVVHACELAAEWRQTFHSDVVVDLVCYRRYGHKKIDEPKMYKVVKDHPSSLEIYQKKLVESGQVTKEDIEKIQSKVDAILNEEFSASKDYAPNGRDGLSSHLSGFESHEQLSRIRSTGVTPEILKDVGQAITTFPENFKPHRAVEKVYEQRAQMIETGEGIDFAVAEALAFATLLVEGNQVRLSGRDVEIGTFTHRLSVVYDQETEEKYCPLDHVVMNQNEEMFTVGNNDFLSDFTVLGSEVGYSMESPNSLVIWEDQFGQCSYGAPGRFGLLLESKWLRQTGLVVLLPHGYDGQGPQQLSDCLKYFLQMGGDVIPEMEPTLRKQIQECNWQVVNVTTPANYFHVLRRQINREFRKPLAVMAPESLFHHKECRSNISEFEDVQGHTGFGKQGTSFQRLIKDPNEHSDLEEGIRRLVLCSGKVYYELDDERKKASAEDVAICRVEQLCPFPYDLIQRELKRYPNAEIVWCQEEPVSMGACCYIAPRLWTAVRALNRGSFEDIKYVCRAPSTATGGVYSDHAQKAILPEPINNVWIGMLRFETEMSCNRRVDLLPVLNEAEACQKQTFFS